jgi:hypothetical protein
MPSACCRLALGVLLALLAAAAAPARAEDLKAEAARLCHAYIERPRDFKTISMQACTVRESFTRQLRDDAQCFRHAVEGSPQPRRFTSFTFGGSCASSTIQEVDEENTAIDLPIHDADRLGWGLDDAALDYQGLLLLTSGNDLRLVRATEQIILCTFMHRFEGWQPPEPADDRTCQKFSRNEYTDRGSPIGQHDWDSWPLYEGWPFKQVRPDLNRDGRDELVVTYDYASGAGCGCDAQPLVLFHDDKIVTPYAPDDGSLPPDMQALATALHELTLKCDRPETIWSVVTIDGKDFVLADLQQRRGDILVADSDEFYSPNEIPSRELYEFRGGKLARICEQKPIAKKVVADDVAPKEGQKFLDYTPPE